MTIDISIDQQDAVVVFGSGTIAGRCIELLRTLTFGEIYVFESKQSGVSVLEKRVSSFHKVFYSLVDENTENRIIQIAPKIIFSINNIYIFKKKIIELCPIVNYHNSLLPKHPGRNAEAWQIFSREKSAGVTWHLVNEYVDKGNLIGQKEIALDSSMTSIKLLREQSQLAFEMFQELAARIFTVHTLEVYEQKAEDNIKFHFSWEIPNNGVLDLSWDAEQISAFLRGMDYGRLYLLGRPRLIYNEKTWTWERYEISHYPDKDNMNICPDNYQASICKNGCLIKLFGLKELEIAFDP